MVKAVTPIPFVKARFFDRCGKPLAGGKVYTYEANTTTPKVTYKDPYGLTPNTNPIILDAAGEADIYLDGTYRIRITDKNDVLVNDVEKIGSWFSDNLQDTLDNISVAMDEALKPILQNLDDAINTAAAAGAGANGWTDVLIASSENVNQRQINDGLESIAQLAGIQNPRNGMRVYVKSYNAPNYALANPFDNGGGTFVYDSTKANINDGGIIINGWVRQDTKQIWVSYFGAKGDGVTDDTAAFQKAVDYMMTNGVGLKIPKSSAKYIINSSVTNTSGGVIDIVADVGAEIDGSNSTAAMLFTLGGNVSTTNYQLTADSAKGSVTIIAPGHNFVAGDIIRIQSTDLWNPTRAYYYKGEMCRVQAVSGDTIFVDTALYDSYTAATTVVTKYNASKCRIDNLKIRRASNQGGLQLQYLKDYSLNNLYIKNANERCLYLLECFNGALHDNQTYGKYYANAGTAYGLSIGSCQHLKMFGGYYNGGRHGMAIGGTFPARDVKMFGIDVDNDGASPQYCMDSHGNAEFIELYGCHIHNAAFLQSANTRIIGGEYRTSGYSASALVLAPEVSCDYLTISNVTGENFAGKSVVGIIYYENDLTFKHITLENITTKGTAEVKSSNYAGMVFIHARNSGANGTFKKLTVDNCNAVFSGAVTGSAYSLAIGANSNLSGDVTLSNNYLMAEHDKTRSHFIAVNGVIKSSNNRYLGSDNANYASAVTKGTFVSTNDTYDCNGSAVYHYISTPDNVTLINPTILNSSNVGLRVASNDVFYTNPTLINVTSKPLFDNTVPYYAKTSSGTKITTNTMPPSKGNWALGDRCFNVNPTNIKVVSWTCTVAGTPGTWVADSNFGLSNMTTASLQNAGAAINTSNKIIGKQVINTTDNKLYYAAGANATDAWRSVDGATVITPA